MSESVSVFGNGFEYDNWHARNCERCAKGYIEPEGPYQCDIEEAVDVAEVSPALAERMGYYEKARVYDARGIPYLGWPCKKREARS